MEKVVLNVQTLSKDAEELSWKDMQEKYKLSKAQLEKALKMKGIQKKRATTSRFEFEEDDNSVNDVSTNAHFPETTQELPSHIF